MDIREFLTARYDEAEQLALAAAKDAGTTDGTPDPYWRSTGRDVVANGGVVATGIEELNPEIADYIARHDPARVLAEIAAKRRILADVLPAMQDAEGHLEYDPGGDWHSDGSDLLLRALAAPYADHADFDPAWRLDD